MPTPILTIEQREEVRTLYATGDYTQRALAERYGVTQSNISAIIRMPERKCVDCGTPLLNKKRCQNCSKALHAAESLAWAREHKAEINERNRVLWSTDEDYRERHREAARKSAARHYVKKHLFTVSENPDGTSTMRCVRCGMVKHVVIQAVESEIGHESA